VLLNVVDNDRLGVDTGIFQGIEGESGAFDFVFEVGGVDEDGEIVFLSHFDVFFKNGEFVDRVFVHANFTNTEDGRLIEKVGDDGHHFAGKSGVVCFFRVDAEPAVVVDPVFGGALGFVIRELAVVVVKPLGGCAVESRPECRFADGFAASEGHRLVIVSRATDHVGVWFDVFHFRVSGVRV